LLLQDTLYTKHKLSFLQVSRDWYRTYVWYTDQWNRFVLLELEVRLWLQIKRPLYFFWTHGTFN